jgi:hypothetical protein
MNMRLKLLNAAVVLGCLGLSPLNCPGAEEAQEPAQADKISTLAKEVNRAAEDGSRAVVAICEFSPKTGQVVRVNGVEQSLEAFVDSLPSLRGDKAKDVCLVCGIVRPDGKVDWALTKKIEQIMSEKGLMNFSILQIEMKV